MVLNRHVRGTLTLRTLGVFGRGSVVAFVVLLAVWAHRVLPASTPPRSVRWPRSWSRVAVAVPVFVGLTFLLRPHGFEDTIDTLRRGLRTRFARLRR